MMNFSDDTLSILKNFSGINPSLLFKPGQVLRTISPQKTVMAAATIDENIDTPAAVYDLSRFLSTLSLFDNPDIQFGQDKFTIQSGRSRVNYTYASESMIVTPPDKDITVPDLEATFNVEWDNIQNVIRAAGVLQLGEIAFRSDGTTISMSAVDSKNPTADNYSVDVAEGNGSTFDMIIKVENMRMMPADYIVSLSSKGMAHFKSTKVQYWIALESK
jgi:hypothetical protein